MNLTAEPLHKLTRKDELFAWTDEYQAMFKEFKCRIVSVPMLKIYDGSTDT